MMGAAIGTRQPKKKWERSDYRCAERSESDARSVPTGAAGQTHRRSPTRAATQSGEKGGKPYGRNPHTLRRPWQATGRRASTSGGRQPKTEPTDRRLSGRGHAPSRPDGAKSESPQGGKGAKGGGRGCRAVGARGWPAQAPPLGMRDEASEAARSAVASVASGASERSERACFHACVSRGGARSARACAAEH